MTSRAVALFVLQRVGSSLVTLFGVSVLVFVAIHLVPGGYEVVILGPFATPQARAALAERFGLNAPLYVQYVRWLAAAVHGDFGSSLLTGLPVLGELTKRISVTGELTLLAAGISWVIGIPIAILAGWPSSGRLTHFAGRLVGAAAMSVPDFVIGTALVYVFSEYSLGLTVGGYVDPWVDPVANLRSILLPAVTLSVFGTALIIRTGRDVVLSVTSEPFMTAAFASGRGSLDIILHHLLRNIAIPLLTVIVTNVGYLLGGAIIVERLFSVPGIGLFMLNALSHRDYAIVQAGVLLAAVIFIVLNTIADISYGLIDPRIGRAA